MSRQLLINLDNKGGVLVILTEDDGTPSTWMEQTPTMEDLKRIFKAVQDFLLPSVAQ